MVGLAGYETPQAKTERDQESVIEYSETEMSEENRAKLREISKRAKPTSHKPIQERVSTDQSANTDIPAPGATADPQSAARDLRDITGPLMRKLAMPIKPLQE